jgi:hypothetical protein
MKIQMQAADAADTLIIAMDDNTLRDNGLTFGEWVNTRSFILEDTTGSKFRVTVEEVK